MAEKGLGGYKSIDKFVEAKLHAFGGGDICFSALFDMCFSEADNIMYERSEGYRIIKTSYGAAKDNTLRLAAVLHDKLCTLERGAVVGLYMDNSLEWIECFWALLACGYRPLLLNLRLDDKSLEQALADCRAGAVISSGKGFGVTTVCFDTLAIGEKCYRADIFGTEILLMSSGTSSHVKVCAYSAKELYYQILDSYDIIKQCSAMKKHYKGHLKLLTFLPFYHIFGLIAVYMWFAFFSRTFVQLNDMQPQTIVNTINRHKVTHIFAVPMFWEKVYGEAIKTIKGRGEKTYSRFLRGMRIEEKLGFAPVLSRLFAHAAFKEVRRNLFGESISFMITGGSSIENDVLSFFNGIGYRLANGYGMTEIGITSVELSSKKRYLNGGYVGKPMSFAEYKTDADGVLYVRGKVIARYIIKDGATVSNDDWFCTGDLAECKDGHYRILGRCDDVVISSSGENLNPNLIEPSFNGIDGVDGVCLIGAKQGGEIVPTLLVSVNAHITPQRKALVEAEIKKRLSVLKLEQQVRKTVLITTPLITGQEFKLNRSRLRADYERDILPVAETERNKSFADGDELAERIRLYFSLALDKPVGDIDDDADFFTELGGTSLDYFALTAKLKEELKVSFPADGDKDLNTVSGIYNFVKSEGKDVC